MFTLFNHEAFRDIVSVIDQNYDRPLHLQIINNEPHWRSPKFFDPPLHLDWKRLQAAASLSK